MQVWASTMLLSLGVATPAKKVKLGPIIKLENELMLSRCDDQVGWQHLPAGNMWTHVISAAGQGKAQEGADQHYPGFTTTTMASCPQDTKA